MCGLYGFSKGSDRTRFMTPILALHMESRGHDSWGVTDGDYTFKHLGQISDSFEEFWLDGAITHTRAASCGAKTIRNAHPFEFTGPDGKVIVGIHNGHVSNWQDLKVKYPERKSFEVDSEHIFAHLAEGKDVGELGGYGNLAWYEFPQGKGGPKTLKFSCFNSDNLHIAQLPEGEVVFASTARAIEEACRFGGIGEKEWFFYKIEKNKVYGIGDNNLVVLGELPWSKNVYHEPVAARGNSSVGGYSSYNRGEGWCLIRGCHLSCAKDDLICNKCLKRLTEEYIGLGEY